MNLSQPYTAICPTLDSQVLAVLARTRKPMTGREIARLTGRTAHAGVLDALARLVDQGVVERQEAGRALLFNLNRDHLAMPAVEVLVGMREELLRRIRETVAAWPVQPKHLSLFGSAARGEGDTHSDIDLFVVRSTRVSEDDARWREQLDELVTRIQRWTGNQANIVEAAETEIPRIRRLKRRIVDDLRSDAILLGGSEITALFGAA
ncbi:MAG TPA: nucleotidyltransferase domain-containing protein [Solirubrobacteraceae bacterium]|nr:nucleotidyltransferase domain-containing protein [Solirubrobacteraceae bacterium]